MPPSASSSSVTTGNEGCPCIDAVQILSSFEKRSCQTPSGEIGILLAPELASCVPLYYGSNFCLQHDLLFSPVCQELDDTKTFCLRNWCYVDLEICKTNSSERAYRSDYFGSSSALIFDDSGGVDLYYSYSTCNSTGAADWEKYKKEQLSADKVLGGVSLRSLATNVMPFGFKRGPTGDILNSTAPEYKNDSVPYEGVYIDYIEKLIGISNGDILMVNYTHRSNAASLLNPTSTGTATVQDVADGLVDLAVGPYWITGERLKMTAFTVPLIYDKTILVIPKPGSKISLRDQTAKVLQPFKPALWALVVIIILLSALLSVWFSDQEKLVRVHRKSLRNPRTNQRRKRVYAKLALDSILQKGMFFFGASVEQEEGASLSNKLLMFGFGFFILIAVSAYVANLAAFLTRPVVSYVGTMQGVVDAGLAICAHPALKTELELKWPHARFVFSNSGKEFYGVLDEYDAGHCAVMAVGREDTTTDGDLLEMFCERNLVFTDSLVLENPIGFPINPELVSGFSYWILEGEKYHGISVQNSKTQYSPHISCNVEFEDQDEDLGDYAQISPVNMILPIITFVACAMAAIIVHIFRKKKVRKASTSALRSVPRAVKYSLASYRMEAFVKNESCTMPISRQSSSIAPMYEHIPLSHEEWVEDEIYDADEDQPDTKNN